MQDTEEILYCALKQWSYSVVTKEDERCQEEEINTHGFFSISVVFHLGQGVEPATTYENLGLPPDWYGALEWVFPHWARKHALDKGEAVNILKGAIVTADRIITVSQFY
ncbi:starch synthase I [Carex littledalei]|uniref:Starch synthase I n=1 Tax=Carex littledalei TaxID=544730 RepID=A0A833VG51_9POAL|nr:starch synthase I [Carex littledalei]